MSSVVAAELPMLPEGTLTGFEEFSRRKGDFAIAMALVTYRLESGAIVEPRVAIGGAETHPRRLPGSRGRARRGNARIRAFFQRRPKRRHWRSIPWKTSIIQLRIVGGWCRRSCSAHWIPQLERAAGDQPHHQRNALCRDRRATTHACRRHPRRLWANGHAYRLRARRCGACTILLDGEPMRSCLMFAVQAHGRSLRTVEGLQQGERLHPMQEAFIRHHGLQCGFCTPGFLMLAVGVLEKRPDLSNEELIDILASNLCRCTGYENIIKAVRAAAASMKAQA